MYAETRDVLRKAHERLTVFEAQFRALGRPYWADQARQAAEDIVPLATGDLPCCNLDAARTEFADLAKAFVALDQAASRDPFAGSPEAPRRTETSETDVPL